MNRIKFVAAALAALLIGGTSANAACKMSQIANKNWIMSATDTGGVTRVLLYCKFRTSGAGTVALTPNGCAVHYGTSADFTTGIPFNLVSATITQNPTDTCTFDLDMALVAPATNTLKARLVMESGKTSLTGSWLSNFTSYGSISLMRQ